MDFIEAQNSYVAEGKDNPKDRVELEIGDSKDVAFKPQIKVMRWDNEVNMSVRLVHNESDPIVSEKDGVVKWEGEKQDAHFYELPVSEDHPEGAAEFEVILKEKPETNVVQFTLNTKGLDFHYQDELTPEEVKHGVDRPENVVGSYAVFASAEKVNYVGGKEYRAGKVGHIYCPKIVDANGVEVWGDLNIDVKAGILSVTIPQEFLDNAAYPVAHAAGLTFGYTTIGGTNALESTNAVGAAKGTPASAVSVAIVNVYCSNAFGGSFKPVIWLDSDKSVITNGVGPAVTPASAAAWRTSTYVSQPSVSTVAYQVGYVINGFLTTYYDSGSSGDGGYQVTNSYTSPTTLLFTFDTRIYSVYATNELPATGIGIRPFF